MCPNFHDNHTHIVYTFYKPGLFHPWTLVTASVVSITTIHHNEADTLFNCTNVLYMGYGPCVAFAFN